MKVRTRLFATVVVAIFTTPALLLHAQNVANPTATTGGNGVAVDASAQSVKAAPSPYTEHNCNYTPRVELFLGYSHFGTDSTDATAGNRMVGLNGGSASIAFNIWRDLGLVVDFGGYAANRLQLTGTGDNQPSVSDASGTVFSYLAGPRLSFRNSSHFTPFAQALFGTVRAGDVTVSNCAGSSCVPLPAQDSFSLAAGGGLDIGLSRHVSIRAVQAEYVMTRFPDVNTGASASQNDLRLSSGLLFRFGDMTPPPNVQLACSLQTSIAFPGDPLTAVATATNLNPRHKAAYSWNTNGGVITGTDSTVTINTLGIAPGTYVVNGHVAQGNHRVQQADCAASFTLQPFEPPTVVCSANPSSVNLGDTTTITAQAVSLQNRTLTYSYSTTAGTVTGSTPTATLATSGVAAGTITVSCNVVDDLGKQASATTNVTVLVPQPLAAPATRNLCSLTFDRDARHPVRVDNEAKGCLDDIALELQRESAGLLVIVGNYAADEKPEAGADRALNVRHYLTEEKGIDASRIGLRVGSDSGRTVNNVFVPAGAIFIQDGTTPVDETVHQ